MEQLSNVWQVIGHVDDFTEGEPAAVVAGDKPVAVFRMGDEVFALHDLCTHGHARLSEGFVEDGCVECPLHQGLFDIRTGAPRCAPVTEAVRAYPIRIVDGQVEIHVD
ncbi:MULTISPECIES: anthranilate 1,2-dioxygenase ferredoxin subunit AndAb [unclassified Caballeronia]|uniref:anthranilate 1,2-dioxygenase ferredoxin subunit AndAb n=1 Tax=unclassified Caballeronia TaxID=2646786 RepID=UPI002862CA7A|nr:MULTISPECIES: anthranilate 1,2-dioxygenase ferredoxin subunit AndAb [unclassified Caballeronia]MDR5776468.1 non-heme iron oxygenase ferredoxin subunit [Caballeronia sp. LZ002]MDR5806606.1 non-heme iron oxygenase ferredoxin subunit [Caballeronia sp. LZ001]MDR5851750.1 non-heme iron oxygenase ferredoxin subunit [Caballeronia sp. LZ003]